MKKRTLPGFTAESSLYSRGGRKYANNIGGSDLKRNSVIAAGDKHCWALLGKCLDSNGKDEHCKKYKEAGCHSYEAPLNTE